MTLGVTLPMAAMAGGTLKAAIDFESSFAGVRKTVDATEAEFEALSKAFRQMSKEIPVSVNEINRIGEAAGQLGIRQENIVGFTRVMADLGATTNMASDQAATSLARLANVTGMSQDDFDRLGASIVELGNNLATTEAEIVEMGLRLAGAGSQIGLTEAQILGLAGALSSVGIQAQAGGTAISRIMIDMAQEVETAGEKLGTFAQVAGMSIDQFRQAFQVDAAGALVTFIEGLGRMSDAGENVFGVLDELELSEIRVRDALLRGAGASDLMRTSLELGSQAWEDNAALTEEASKRYETTGSQLKIMWNTLKDVAITLGTALIPALKGAVDAAAPFLNFLKNAAEGFSNLSSGMKTAVIGFGLFVAGIGPVIWAVGSLMKSIAALQTALIALRAVAATTWAVMLGPITLIAAALALVGYNAKRTFDIIQNRGKAATQSLEEWDAAVKRTHEHLVEMGEDISRGDVAWEALEGRLKLLTEEEINLARAEKAVADAAELQENILTDLDKTIVNLDGNLTDLNIGLVDTSRSLSDRFVPASNKSLESLLAMLDALEEEQRVLSQAPLYVSEASESLAAMRLNMEDLTTYVDANALAWRAHRDEVRESVEAGQEWFLRQIQFQKNQALAWPMLAETIHNFTAGFTDAAGGWVDSMEAVEDSFDSARDAVLSFQDALSKLSMGKAIAVGAAPGGLGKIFQIAEERGVSLQEATAILNRQIREAVAVGMQHGGIVTKPTLTMLGEAGPEAVIPLSQPQAAAAPMFHIQLVLDGQVLAEWQGNAAENEEMVRSS